MADTPYTQTFTSFSGADIVATFGSRVIGELQGITYSITREKAPIYTMGSPDPRSFSRGKRGIAGNIVFTVFDRDALLAEMTNYGKKADVYGWGSYGNSHGDALSMDTWNNTMTGQAVSSGGLKGVALTPLPAMYVDELPPFDVTITFANEYGQVAVMTIYGVEILNEGSGMSIDDVVTERAMTYVARRIDRIHNLAENR
jgi:hypothetical protein